MAAEWRWSKFGETEETTFWRPLSAIRRNTTSMQRYFNMIACAWLQIMSSRPYKNITAFEQICVVVGSCIGSWLKNIGCECTVVFAWRLLKWSTVWRQQGDSSVRPYCF